MDFRASYENRYSYWQNVIIILGFVIFGPNFYKTKSFSGSFRMTML